MASSGKKGKKSKGKTLALNDFLQETPGPAPTIRKPSSWADEVENTYDDYDSSTRVKQQVVLPTAPKAARGLDDYNDKIPKQPPYIAYLSNLPYDVNEDEIADFFSNMKIANMRIPKEDRPGETPKLRGFGYVEFEDRESLLCALAIPDCTLKNRRIRIEVATNSENDRRRGGRMDSNRDRQERPEVSMGDWRSEGRSSENPDNERRSGFNRDRDRGERDRDRGERDRDRGERDAQMERGWRDGDRPNFREKDIERSRGFGPPVRRNDRDERNGANIARNRDDAPTERSEPRTRPKLNLAPRTKPLESVTVVDETVDTTTTTATATVTSKAPNAPSIFGNAKPVDTTAREREIEERLAKEQEKRVEVKETKTDDEKPKRDEDIRRSPRSIERRYSPKRTSPYRNKYSPDRNRSNERRKMSPDRRRASPEKNRGPPKKNDEKRFTSRAERLPPKEKIDKPEKPKKEEKPRDYTERDMPKVKQPEPQNFVTSNQYAYLETEDNSD